MYPNGQVFRNQLLTPRALLGCVAGINFDTRSTSILSFEERILPKLSPACIRYAFGKIAVLQQALDIQPLKDDQVIRVDQLAARLVGKVAPAIGNALVDLTHHFAILPSLRRALLALAEPPLRFRQRFLIAPEEARVLNGAPIRQRQISVQTAVYARIAFRLRQWLGFDFARETGIPFAQTIASDGERLDLTFQGTVQLDLDAADLGEVQRVRQIEPKLFERDAVVSPLTLETGIAWLFACFHAAEERLKSQVNALLNVLQHLREYLPEFWTLTFPLGEELVGLVQIHHLAAFFPRLFASGKRFIVDPPAQLKRLLKLVFLGMSRVEEKAI